MLEALAIIAVLVIAVLVDANERSSAKRVDRAMDKIMGRDDD